MSESDESANAQIVESPPPGVTPDSAGDVFVSYASQNAATANALVTALERQGLKCWIAPRDVAPGALYADEIINAINGTKVLVLVLSENAVASPHVGKELERASSKRKPIVTLRTDTALLTTAFEYFLSESQWIDIAADGTEIAFGKVVTAVRRRMTPASGVSSLAGSERFAPRRSPTGRKRFRLIIATVAALCVALVWMAIDRIRSSRLDEPVAPPATQPTAAAIAPQPAPFTPPPHSVAVLPFVNMSGDAKQEYFSDGISEELLNALSRLNDLQVVARTSSFAFKGKDVDVSTIAHKLNVGAILEGSVRRAGDRVRITVQLVNALSGFRLWSQTYDRKWVDVLNVQTEVATAVAQQLEGKLTDSDVEKIELGGTKSQVAYEAYLHGAQLGNLADDEKGYRAALKEYDRAIALDANYAAAYVGRAFMLTDLEFYADDSKGRRQVQGDAIAAARHAVTLAPDFGQAHLVLGIIFETGLLDLSGAAPEYERALALAPGSASVQRNIAPFYIEIGHVAQAITAARRAVSLDPQNWASHQMLSVVLYYARRYPEAQAALQDADTLSPGSHELNKWLTAFLLASGENQHALQLCESTATPLDEGTRYPCLAVAYHALGRQTEAEQELDKLRALAGDNGAYVYAEIYAQWGDKPAALRWLSKAAELRDPSLPTLRVDWMLDPIRDEPGYKAIEARMNFPP
jgi:TolB-like protein/tetratricopeptide (TPR) repeat protein